MRFLHHLFPSQGEPVGAPLPYNLRSWLYLAYVVTMLRQGLLLARAPHALRWRLETFGLYMPSLPESRPWWRVDVAALRALLRQLPGYMRWLYQMQALRRGGAQEFWRLQARGDATAWEAWLALSDDEALSHQLFAGDGDSGTSYRRGNQKAEC